ncbi:MAG TPA: hypothetical protein PLB87_05970 [Prolixibacteraceae bacterium]|nr:hypothetical protein [Prolixibacteraceae bacterium]
METNNHIWQFSRIGGMNRVSLESGEDLLHLDSLDQKLWTALSCPVKGLEIDPKTLELIDGDHDGKIRVPEVLEAVRWITSVVKDANCLLEKKSVMPLSVINTNTPLGKISYASSKQILANIGKPDAEELTVEEASDTVAIFENTLFNGDGIIHAASTDDEALKTLIGQIIQCEGPLIDRSGNEGTDSEKIEAFFTQCEIYSNWKKKAEDEHQTILPFGEQTEMAFASFKALKSKIDDYFLRCQLAEFDPASVEMLNSILTRIETITTKDLPDCMEDISNFPLAKIEAEKPLSLVSGINPAWREPIENFRTLISTNTKKQKHEISEKEWKEIASRFVAYQEWMAEKAGVEVEPLGYDVIQSILVENKKEALLGLIEEDKKLEEEANNIILVEQLVRYYRDLFTLLNNFVNFSDFYRPGSKAIFQAGKLYFDQRCCDLCIKVSDLPKHHSMAASSGICLVYCDCFSKTRDEKMTIVAAFTDGDVDNLVIGRNAIFYDNAGNDWDAIIIKIIDNPISIRQAFWSPYRKFSQFINKQIEKFASSKDQEVQKAGTAKIEQTTTHVATATSTPEAAKPAPFDIAKFAGIFAAIGLAFGAIGGVLATIAKGFFSLKWWEMPIALVAVILCISGPSMILAWLKLRKRNLAPVLDANGWAVNARATINIAFGTTLTHLAKLPKDSKLNFIDPYRKKANPWITTLWIFILLLVLAFAALWFFGYLKGWGIMKTSGI